MQKIQEINKRFCFELDLQTIYIAVFATLFSGRINYREVEGVCQEENILIIQSNIL